MDLAQLVRWLAAEGHAQLPGYNALARWLFTQGPGRLNGLLLRWVAAQEAQGLAAATINRRLAAVKSLVKLGRTLGTINWALDVAGVRGAQGVRDMHGPTVEEVRKLLHTTRDRPFVQAILYLLFTRGLRSIEVRELQLRHLELDRGVIFVRGKGKAGLSQLTLGPAAVAALRAWLRVRVGGREDTAPVFTLRSGRVVSHTTLWATVRQAGLFVGVAVRPHGLRHSAITAVLNQTNGDIRTAQRFSRQVKPETLLRYDDERRDLGGEAAKRLDELMEETPKP